MVLGYSAMEPRTMAVTLARTGQHSVTNRASSLFIRIGRRCFGLTSIILDERTSRRRVSSALMNESDRGKMTKRSQRKPKPAVC
jgi:hypothetical protein